MKGPRERVEGRVKDDSRVRTGRANAVDAMSRARIPVIIAAKIFIDPSRRFVPYESLM